MFQVKPLLKYIVLSLLLSSCGSDSLDSQNDPDIIKPPPAISDLLPAIELTRSTGELPFHVYVSASPTLMDGVEHAYDEVIYSWNFGDSDGREIITHPVTQELVNANIDQQGPEAAYVYRHAGSYDITLNATYQRDDELLEETTHITVNATLWTGETRYVDPQSGNDESMGDSIDTPWQSWSAMVDWLKSADHRRALIKRGTIMPVTHNVYLSTSHIRLGAYGEGEKPELIAEEKIDNFIRLSAIPDIQEINDHVYSDLSLNGNNGNAGSLIYSVLFDSTARLSHLALIDMTLINDDPHEVIIDPATSAITEVVQAKNLVSLNNQPGSDSRIDDVLIWRSDFQRNHSFKNGIYAEMKGHLAIVGTTFSGGDGNLVKDHPIYPAGINHALFRWIDFKDTYSNNFAINNVAKDSKTLHYTLVDGCSISGTRNGLDFTRHRADALGWFSDLIIQNNAFSNLGLPSQGYGIIGGSLKRAVIRNNVFYANTGSDIIVTKDVDSEVDLHISNNKMWKSNKTDTLPMVDLKDVLMLKMTGNTFVYEGDSGGSRLLTQFVIPENKIWVIDDNQYWAPGLSTAFKEIKEISGTRSSFYYDLPEWQALGYDTNSVETDPGFVNPEQGVF